MTQEKYKKTSQYILNTEEIILPLEFNDSDLDLQNILEKYSLPPTPKIPILYSNIQVKIKIIMKQYCAKHKAHLYFIQKTGKNWDIQSY